MTKNLFHYLTLCVFALSLVACGSDDDGSNPTPTVTNANRNIVTANVPKEITRLEFPHLRGGDNIVIVHKTDNNTKINYSVEWDYGKKSPRWSCFPMTNGSSKGGVGRNGPFEEDPDLPSSMRFSDTNYMFTGSGYDRGHMCASYDRQYSKEANHQTFYYTNMQPQRNAFNA